MQKRSLFSAVAAAVLISGAGCAQAQTMGQAPVNLLQNGDFEAPLGAQYQVAGWPGVNKYVLLSSRTDALAIKTEGTNHYLSITNADAAKSASTEQVISVAPGTHLLLSGRMRVSQLTPGKQSFHNARVQTTWQDGANKALNPYPTSPFQASATQGWVKFEEEMTAPANVSTLKVSPAIFNALGQADFDDLVLRVVDPNAVKLPAGIAPTWGQEPVEVKSATRAEVVLNGLWQFQPATEQNTAPPQTGYGFIAVPGAWGGEKGSLLPGVAARDNAWKETDLKTVNRAWYARPLMVPVAWANRKITLDFNRVSTDAQVFVNNVDCGRVAWPYGSVDITRAVTPGEAAQLRVLVIASLDSNVQQVFMGTAAEQVYTAKSTLDTKGITGDVVLKSAPIGAQISDVFVQPSVRQHKLTLDVELQDMAQAGPVQLQARVLDDKGVVAKTFTTTQNVQTGTHTLRMTSEWANPKLWDLNQPNLYTVMLRASGAGLNDEYAQSFGFREFWVQGKGFMLNGTPIRLRPTVLGNEANDLFLTREEVDGAIDGFRYTGFNIQEFWPSDRFKRGAVFDDGLYFSRADVKGWPIIGALPSMAGLAAKWSDAGVRDDYIQKVGAELRRFRNHPSVFAWVHSPNRFGNWQDQNPRFIGQKTKLAQVQDGSTKQLPAAFDANNIIKQIDPTRPVSTHQGGVAGDFQMTNNYLNFIPFQEQEEWLSDWAQTGEVPYLPVEFGFILGCDLRRGRNTGGWGKWGATMTEDWGTEFLAEFYGRDAYAQESQKHRDSHGVRLVRDAADALAGAGSAAQKDVYAARVKLDPGQVYREYEVIDPLAQQMQANVNERNYRSWRTMGTTAGMINWEYAFVTGKDKGRVEIGPFVPGRRGVYRPTLPKERIYYAQPEADNAKPELGGALKRADSATLAWICGPEVQGDIAAFTSKEHSFFAGQRVAKRIALLNDTRAPQAYSVTTRVMIGSTLLKTETKTGNIGIAQTTFVPFEFRAQSNITTRPDGRIEMNLDERRTDPPTKTDGRIEMTAKIGDTTQTDVFNFRIFSPTIYNANNPDGLNGKSVLLFDPQNKSGALLKSLGFTATVWNGQTSNQLLVIGREAMSGGTLPGNLEAFVQQGGRVLMLEQTPAWLRSQGFRVGAQVRREIYAVDANHPVAAGLDAVDLRDWAGNSTLVDPKPIITDKDKSSYGYPVHGWKWGNRGGVSSAMIEKPHRSSWRPILEGDFDLSYTPLMEMDYGQGRLTLCTLDLEDHAALDAGAAKLAANVFNYAGSAPLAPKARIIGFLGGEAWAAKLTDLGVRFSRGEGVPATLQGDTLLLIDPKATVSADALTAFAQSGGRVVVLPSREGTQEAGVKLATLDTFTGSLNVPAWDECRGLSPSDLRYRAPRSSLLLQASDGVEVGADGLLARRKIGRGEIMFAQLDPDRFDADTLTYFRFTRWRQTRALAQVLANMGATFNADSDFFNPDQAITRLALGGEWKAMLTAPIAQKAGVAVADPGFSTQARAAIAPDFNDAAMQTVSVPGAWESYGGAWAQTDGEAVFRKTLDVPASMAGQDLLLTLGSVDDFDTTFFNGVEVGSTGGEETSFSVQRRYTIPGKLVKAGRNVLAIRVFDRLGDGGFTSNVNDLNLRTVASLKNPGGLYHNDYRSDFPIADDPHRYYRW